MLEKGALFVFFIKIIRRLAKSIILKDIIIKQNTGKVEKNIMLLGIERESPGLYYSNEYAMGTLATAL